MITTLGLVGSGQHEWFASLLIMPCDTTELLDHEGIGQLLELVQLHCPELKLQIHVNS